MEKRYFPFSEYLKNKFGTGVRKICVDGGFTCPNRDGRVGRGGCIYCNNAGFNPNLRQERLSVKEQVLQGIEYMKKRYGARKFIVYFQPFSNTYADLETLKNLYSDAVSHEDVVGLAVGTRPDCVPNEVLDYIQSYTQKYEVWLEYGLQSAHDRTLFLINRGHTFSQFIDAIERTKSRGIKICVHVILGLPGENEQDMMETAAAISRMKIDGIKLHNLHVVKGTVLEKMFLNGECGILTLEEYVRLVCNFLELLPPEVVVQRLCGDAPEDLLLAPQWCRNKSLVLSEVDKEFIRRNSWQGSQLNRVSLNTG
ncbi:MAG: TIGR01212 family radical SAM protein [Candidatus Omnitrophica bacterium]|nr:TIGR01212 family radical SAM protein [Candidatus Omnitrophota bacterium]